MKIETYLRISVIFSIIFSGNMAYSQDEINKERIYKFSEVSLQRSWYYGMELLPLMAKELREEHERTMVTAAFHYWVMRDKNLIQRMPGYEAQIKGAYLEKQLGHELFKDPLRMFTEDGPRYSLAAFRIESDEYKSMVPKFIKFITEFSPP